MSRTCCSRISTYSPVNPTDSTGIGSAINSAHAKGVVLVAVGANADGPVTSFVRSKNFDAGRDSCEFNVIGGCSMGALSVIESSGKGIKLISVDGAPEAVDAIEKPGSNSIETSTQYPADQIRLAIGITLACAVRSTAIASSVRFCSARVRARPICAVADEAP